MRPTMQDINRNDLEKVTGGADAQAAIKEWQDFCGKLYAKADKLQKERYTPAAEVMREAAGSCMDRLGAARDTLGLRSTAEY